MNKTNKAQVVIGGVRPHNGMVHLSQIDSTIRQEFRDMFTVDNPEYEDAKKFKYLANNIPKQLCYTENDRLNLFVPPAIGLVLWKLNSKNVPFNLIDQRVDNPGHHYTFNGVLRQYQQDAVNDVLSQDYGILKAPTASGKTVMALNIISHRRQKTLVLCHSKELLTQWIDRASVFLSIPKKDIGILGAGKKKIGTDLTIGTIQTVSKNLSLCRDFGFVIADECHRATAKKTWQKVLMNVNPKYRLGLSATPWRSDGNNKPIFWTLGQIVHSVNRKVLINAGTILKAKPISVQTNFKSQLTNSHEKYQRLINELTRDDQRNTLICETIKRRFKNKPDAVVLVLSDRVDHIEELDSRLVIDYGLSPERLVGATTPKERERVVSAVNAGTTNLLLSTTSCLGEGFDCKNLDTLVLGTPISFDGRIIQSVGRIMRTSANKSEAVVIDFNDTNEGVLKGSFYRRQRIYKR